MIPNMTSPRLSEHAVLILSALAEAPLHGYGIVRVVEQMSDGQVRLSVGTLYGLLDRLVARGVVERDRDEVHHGRLRRYYRLTSQGAEELAQQARRLASTATLVQARLGLRRAQVSGEVAT